MTLKLKGSSDGSVSLSAPADTSPSGTDVTLTLPTSDGDANQILETNGSGALSWTTPPVAGISEFDMFYLDSDKTSSGDLTDWDRNDLNGAPTQIGTGMSVSSGVFTFPSTGKWLVYGKIFYGLNNDVVGGGIFTSTDGGSNFSIVAALAESSTTDASAGDSTIAFVDVTNTANVKVKMTVDSVGGGCKAEGASGTPKRARTLIAFVRLGAT